MDKISFERKEDREQIEKFKQDMLKDPKIVTNELNENARRLSNFITARQLGIKFGEPEKEKENE